MSDQHQTDKQQTTKEFLFSKEGRSTLVVCIAVIGIFGFVGWWAWGSLFAVPEPARPSADQIASNGSGSVSAGGQQNIRADLTSDNRTDEARAVANEYNESAASHPELHPVPTGEDVEIIPVLNLPKTIEVDKPNLDLAADAEPTYTFTPPNIPRRESYQPGSQASGQRVTESERKFREARLSAATDIIDTFREAAVPQSVSFSRVESTTGAERNTIAHVARDGDENHEFKPEQANNDGQECEAPAIRPGEIRYAINSIALNTDFRGPIKVEFLDGNIAGWTGMGSFELNEYGARMKATVNRVIDPYGQSYPTKGYVLDPETTLWATASDVDRHIIYRYGGFGLATILSGFAELAEARKLKSQRTGANGELVNEYREPDSKQITWTLLGAFSELWATAFRDNLSRPITVTLDPNVELGVLFEEPVCPVETAKSRRLEAAEEFRKAGMTDPVQ